MKKTFMLKKNYEFKKVLTKGKYFSGEFLDVFVIKNHKNYNLLGLAISVKSAKAVKRNKIKRFIRESYRNIEDCVNTGNSIVFLWNKKKDVNIVNYKEIRADIENIFNKAEIMMR